MIVYKLWSCKIKYYDVYLSYPTKRGFIIFILFTLIENRNVTHDVPVFLFIFEYKIFVMELGEYYKEDWQQKKESVLLNKDLFKDNERLKDKWPEDLEIELFFNGDKLLLINNLDDELIDIRKDR